MKKSIVIGIIIIAVLLVVGYFVFNSSENDLSDNTSGNSLDSIPASEFANLDSDGQVLNEIDSSMETLG